MDSALGHIGNIISTDDRPTEIYLFALDEHLNNNTSQRDITHVLDTINFLLSKAKTRIRGLQLLDKVLPWVNQELLEQKIQLWVTFILKACNQDELRKYGGLIYKLLMSIAKILRQFTELSKNFASNHLNKVYEVITQSPTKFYIYALQCAEAYLATYPKPSGQSREAVVRFLKSFPDKFDDQVNYYAGRCLHILQQTIVPGSKDIKSKEQWKAYQFTLIENLSAMLNEAYSERSENSLDANGEGANINLPPLKLSTEPDERAAQLFVRFHNLVNYLEIAIREPNLTYKPIAPKKILNLITTGLVITCTAINKNITYSKIAFGIFLPKVQLDLLKLSQTLIRSLHCHLRMYYKSVFGCLIHVLKSTSATNKTLRMELYNVIRLWCETFGEGSRCELYVDELVPELLNDISPAKNKLISQMKPNAKNKKGYMVPKITKESLSNTSENQAFSLASIRCLRTLLRSCACFVKPSTINIIQTNTLKYCASFYVTKRCEAYNNWQIRLEMYKLLQTILMTPNQYSPPPSHILLYILCTAQSSESNADIRITCTKLLEQIEKILHPQKESLLIPIEARTVRNAFSKIGQEKILENSHVAFSSVRYDQDFEHTANSYKNYQHHQEKSDFEIVNVENVIELSTNSLLHRNSSINNKEATKVSESECLKISNAKKEKYSQNNGTHQITKIAEDQSLDAPESKKQKIALDYDSTQQSSRSIDVSDDSSIEEETLKPLTSVQEYSKETTEKEKNNLTEMNKKEQLTKEKLIISKNDSKDFAELESFFVDELKESFNK